MLDSESRIALGMSQFANLTNGEREITPTVDVELCALYHPWQCIGTPPQNAHLAFPGLSDYGLSDDVQISLVQTPQRHKKCEYVCNDGYKYTV